MNSYLYLYAGVLTGAAGVACLYTSWKRRLVNVPGPVLAGWLLMLLSCWLWIRAFGAEFGGVYALLFIPAAAWVLVLINAEIRHRKPREQRTAQPVKPGTHTRGQHVLLFLIAVPMAAVAATYIGIGVSALLPWDRINQHVLAVFLMPVLWGIGACWACADPKMSRPALYLATGGLVSAALLHL